MSQLPRICENSDSGFLEIDHQHTNLLTENLLWDVSPANTDTDMKKNTPNHVLTENLLWKIEKEPSSTSSVLSSSSSSSSLSSASPVSISNSNCNSLVDDALEVVTKNIDIFRGEDNENENNDDNYDNIISMKPIPVLDDTVPDEDGNQEPTNCTFNAWVNFDSFPQISN